MTVGTLIIETQNNLALLFSGVIGTGIFLSTTYLFMDHSEETVISPVMRKLKNEVANLKEALRNKEQMLQKAQEKIMLQDSQLERYKVQKHTEVTDEVVQLEKLLNATLLTESDWQGFRKSFNELYRGYLTRLKVKYSNLTEGEIRLIALMKLKLSNKEMARMLGISRDSIVKSRYRLKKKLCAASSAPDLKELIHKV